MKSWIRKRLKDLAKAGQLGRAADDALAPPSPPRGVPSSPDQPET